MGYYVSVDRGTHEILKQLEEAPRKLLHQPYAGYLLFLIGKADQQSLSWLVSHVAELDSLTGRDVAFLLFTRELKLSVSVVVGGGPRSHSPADSVTLPIADFDPQYRGRFARVLAVTGLDWKPGLQEVTAMTYAVDEVARALGVLDRLPCMVALDPVAHESMILSADAESLGALIPLLRSVIQHLESAQTYKQLLSALTELGRLQENEEKLRAGIADLLQKEASITPQACLAELSDFCANRNQRLAEELSSCLGASRIAAWLHTAATEHKAIGKAIRCLDWIIRTGVWPLQPPQMGAFSWLERTMSSRLGLSVMPYSATAESCAELRSVLLDRERECNSIVSTWHPTQQELMDDVQQLVAKKLEQVARERNALQKSLADVTQSMLLADRDVAACQDASFTQILRAELHRRRIGHTAIRLVDVVKAAVSPEKLLEWLRALGGHLIHAWGP